MSALMPPFLFISSIAF